MPCGPMKQNVLTPIIFRQNIDQTTTEAKKKRKKQFQKCMQKEECTAVCTYVFWNSSFQYTGCQTLQRLGES